jgi:crotonobetainyl-CoA:carnitine CoA-transferase CaiB-like acyl-CoA transferase
LRPSTERAIVARPHRRLYAPQHAQDSDRLFFLLSNINKRNLTPNLKTARGKELFKELIAKSDVLVENFSPGALDRLGLGWGALEGQLPPDLRDDQGLWQLWALRQLQEFRAGRSGDGRGDERHRLPGEPADLCRPGDRHMAIGILAALLADPHLKAREMILDIDYPTRGTYKTVGCPIKLSDSPAEVSRPPLLGEHSETLLRELCGVSPDEIKYLRDDGVI